ncbi:hypothetical protein ACJMK2_015916 [Sinanodonta woodiana]|uniref:Uncharacterized protein n=1 Tax=Sinanodonta woodiana TaxID=1069815 RepID=A0ABD3UUS1_SINWO
MSVKHRLGLKIPLDNSATAFENVEYLHTHSNEPNETGIQTFNTRGEGVSLLPHNAILTYKGRLLIHLETLVLMHKLHPQTTAGVYLEAPDIN